jgi:hypothetical protein
MPIEAVITVFIIFASITAIVLGPFYLKSRERGAMQETVRHAIDKGQPLPPEMIDALTRDIERRLPSRSRDIRMGVILFATGAGVAICSYLFGLEERELVNFGTGVSFIPMCLGVAFIILSFFNKNKD